LNFQKNEKKVFSNYGLKQTLQFSAVKTIKSNNVTILNMTRNFSCHSYCEMFQRDVYDLFCGISMCWL